MSLYPSGYNYPPFEDAVRTGDKASGGMPCTTCTHPTCRHSPARNGVGPCPACPPDSGGTLVLDPVSAPNWRVDCNLCNFLMYLPKSLHKAAVSSQECEACGMAMMALTWKQGQVPSGLPGVSDEGKMEVCLVCNEAVAGMCEVKHGRAFVRRGGGGRGRRGRGGRGRRRGRGRDRIDPLMSFYAF